MMSSPTPIITPPTKPKFIEDWRDGWKFYTTWGYAILIAFPDLYNLASPYLEVEGMPSAAAWGMRAVAVAGLVVRFVNQKKPAK
jgi:hypothetical protein